jgi:hypothetical protein
MIMAEYTSKAIVTEISATSRVAIKVRDNFYTVEYTEKRAIPDVEGIDIEAERVALFDAVNGVVDAQAEDIIRMTQPNKK